MKIKNLAPIFFLALLLWLPGHATETRQGCLEDLRNLIVPALKNSAFVEQGYGGKIQLDVDDYSDGVYSFRLFLPKKPEPDSPNTSGAVGWVKLDVKNMRAYDESVDPDHPTELKLNSGELNSIVKKCSL